MKILEFVYRLRFESITPTHTHVTLPVTRIRGTQILGA